ncbi:MAG: HTTM domain-containing protein [Patescibacteria group bacterium]
MKVIRKIFSLDLRALAIMRIAIGFVLIFDLLVRATDLLAFYTDYGVLPREAVIMNIRQIHFLSLHLISGELNFQIVLFLIALWCNIQVLIGNRTRMYTFLAWLLLLSIQNRNTLIGQAGDDVLRLALMWGIFLPWNARYAIDALRIQNRKSNDYFGVSTIGLTLLIFSLYFFSACMKTAPEWTKDFTAVYYALSLDQIALPFGKWIYPYPNALKMITASVYYIELFAPFLLFIFWKKEVIRLVFTFVFLLFHIGLASTLFIGFFPFIVIAVLLGFLSSPVMDTLDSLLRTLRKRFSKLEFFKVKVSKEGVNVSRLRYAKIQTIFLITLVVYQLAWNFKSASWISSQYIPLQSLAYNLRIDQSWGMFAPGVFKEDGWFLFEGVTDDGRVIDISRDGQQMRYGKPQHISSMFKNDRWRKYTENLLMKRNHELRFYYTAYLHDRWMLKHPEISLSAIRIIYMKELSLPDYQIAEPKREVLVEWKRTK